MSNYQQTKKIIIRGIIEAKTGLAIGGSNTAIGIGGVDKGVIRNPVTNQPYIPGSSLKGKMRSLVELRDGTIGEFQKSQIEHGPTDNQDHAAARLFGNAAKSQEKRQRPSRIIVRDAYLIDAQVPKDGQEDFFKNTDLPFTEVKTEVVIDRLTSRAMPRQIERVPAGAKFDFELIVSIFNEDNEQELIGNTFSALRLVENDYIGGHGSRGSGQVTFEIVSVKERTKDYYIHQSAETDITDVWRPQFPQ